MRLDLDQAAADREVARLALEGRLRRRERDGGAPMHPKVRARIEDLAAGRLAGLSAAGRMHASRHQSAPAPESAASSPWITVADAAERLALDESQVRRLLGAGRLPGQRFGRRTWMVDRAAVEAERERRRERAEWAQ